MDGCLYFDASQKIDENSASKFIDLKMNEVNCTQGLFFVKIIEILRNLENIWINLRNLMKG